MTLHFSDGSALALRHVDPSHYKLSVESLNATILALASPAKSSRPAPRVLALTEGKALVKVTLWPGDGCPGQVQVQEQPGSPGAQNGAVAMQLSSGTASVEVALKGHQVTSVQNDARTGSSDATQSYTLSHSIASNPQQVQVGETATKRRMTDANQQQQQQQQQHQQRNPGAVQGQGQLTFSKPGSTVEFGENQLSLKDDSSVLQQPHSHAHPIHPYSSAHMTAIEIGMYVLLAVFCAAIAVFVATCLVYASRARKDVAGVAASDAVAGGRARRGRGDEEQDLPPSPGLRLQQFWNFKLNRTPRGVKDRRPADGNEAATADEPQETSDRNWIWLGRSNLTSNDPLQSLSGEPALSVDPRPHHPRDTRRGAREEAAATANRLSGVSYTGSEVGVRIMSHSRPQDGGRVTYTAELCFGSSDSIGSSSNSNNNRALTGDLDGHPSAIHQQKAAVDSLTYTKRNSPPPAVGAMRVVTNPGFAVASSLSSSKIGRASCRERVSSPV